MWAVSEMSLTTDITFFFKEIYFTDSIYSVYKDKLQNCSFNQSE